MERVKGERWEEFRDRHGDWGRDMAFWLGRREGRMKLNQMGEFAGGLDYTSVGSAISRLGRRVKADKTLAAKLAEATRHLSNARDRWRPSGRLRREGSSRRRSE